MCLICVIYNLYINLYLTPKFARNKLFHLFEDNITNTQTTDNIYTYVDIANNDSIHLLQKLIAAWQQQDKPYGIGQSIYSVAVEAIMANDD